MGVSTGVLAQPSSPAALFGAREGVEGVALSPDGDKVAFLAPSKGQGNILYTVDLTTGGAPKVALFANGDPERILKCQWVSNLRLTCDLRGRMNWSGQIISSIRPVAVNADGSDLKLLAPKRSQNADFVTNFAGMVVDYLPGDENAVLMQRLIIPERATGTRMTKTNEGMVLERVDTVSLRSTRVTQAMRLANYFMTDGRGQARIMSLRENDDRDPSGITRYSYQPTGTRDWQRLGEFDTINEIGFRPSVVDADSDSVYGFEKVNGRWALFAIKLDGSLTKTKIFERDDVDVDGVITIGRDRKVIGYSYATDKRTAVYFDPAYNKLGQALVKAVPDAELINFAAADNDGQKMIIWAGSDTNPGQYYHFDNRTSELSPLFPSRPELEGVKLASVTPVSAKARDGVDIPAYLTLPPGREAKNLPTIIMPHGGPSSRDEWGFDWLAQFFANAGFAVLQPNFRGSSGYGDEWFKDNGFKSWPIAIGDINDSARWLASEGIADPARMAIVGWSYGGYAALQSNVVEPDLFQAVVAVAPVTDLARLRNVELEFAGRRSVKDIVGSPASFREASPAQNAAKIKAPVLLFHGDVDTNVGVQHSRDMAGKLKEAGQSVRLIEFPDADHQLNDADIRTRLLQESLDFIDGALRRHSEKKEI